jgi:hypothetical protein
MEKDQRALLHRIESFLAQTGMAPTTFGKLTVNDGHLVKAMREGRDLRGSTFNRLVNFIEKPPTSHCNGSGAGEGN